MQLLNSVALSHGPCGDSARAVSSIAQGTPIFRIEGVLIDSPRRHTIQIGHRVHILPEGRLWGYMNHSCEPNCRVEFATWTVVAGRPILEGEEITFNYLTTEWDMSAPFECRCGSPICFGYIQGFAHLSSRQREALAPFLSPYLTAHRRSPRPRHSAWRASASEALLAPSAALTVADRGEGT